MDAILTGPFGPTQLSPGVTVLGRTQDNQIVVNDAKASSHHAELRSTGQDYTIVDLGSTNGTYVNDQQIDRTQPRPLYSGDRIRIGDTTYTFELRPSMGAYGVQGSSPNFAPTQIAQPQYSGTAYGGNAPAQNFAPTQPATDFQQAGFQQYPPAQQNHFTPPPAGSSFNQPPAAAPFNQPPVGSSFNQYNQQAPGTPYSPPPPPQQYNAMPQYGPVPGSYPAQNMPPYGTAPATPKRGGGLRMVLLAGLALIVVLGALATFFIVRNNQIAATNATATATSLTATAHSQATSVAIAHATGTAVVNATATAGAGGGGTPQDGAYATGNVALYDPLKDNTGGNQWEESSYCSFTNQVYEAKESHQNTFVTCFAQATNFSNFSYRVLMTVVSGDCSGIAFRGDANTNKQYYYEVCPSGTYDLLYYDGTNDKYLIQPTTSSAIKTGVGKINLVAITANNDTIQLYANGTLLNTAQDASIASGSIGVVSINHNSSGTDAIFAGAKVWSI